MIEAECEEAMRRHTGTIGGGIRAQFGVEESQIWAIGMDKKTDQI